MGSSQTLLAQVQGWLDPTKLTINPEEGLDAALVEAAHDMVFARMVRVYNVTGWVDQNTIPSLVQKAMSLLLASWYYARQYSEVTAEDENKYAARLESMSEDLCSGLESGMITLVDADQTAGYEQPDKPDFEPNPQTDSGEVYSSLGQTIGRMGSNDVKFRMSARM